MISAKNPNYAVARQCDTSKGFENFSVEGAASLDRKNANSHDDALARRYKKTLDNSTLKNLIELYEGELLSYLNRYCKNEEIAKDAMQNTWIKVHTNIGTFRDNAKFRPWLYTIATRAAIDELRKNKKHPLTSLDGQNSSNLFPGESGLTLRDLLISKTPPPEVQLEKAEAANSVRKAYDSLSEPLKDAINLIYFQGLKYCEAATILNIPMGTVKSRLHIALTKILHSSELKYLTGL